MPMYSEAKVVIFLCLSYPKTQGTTYIYETFFRPYVASHETEIDRSLLELKVRAGDMIFLYCQKAAMCLTENRFVLNDHVYINSLIYILIYLCISC
ncbi:HVA22-like protein i [Platanthera guangdongensis]|uniref:HVA22-like protein n=1 Tax=Platanthera guangdongensis TaxID=2320717 RepID=A0ABR2N5M5_9ASPA